MKGARTEGDKGAETEVHINRKSSPLNEVIANTEKESSVLVLRLQLRAEEGKQHGSGGSSREMETCWVLP